MDKYHTQWAGQFYVAAELTRRGYAVTLTLGNARRTDLIVLSPSGELFKVEVKAQQTKSFWIVSEPPSSKGHYYVLVYVPKPPKPPEFFVMTCAECQQLRMAYKQAIISTGGRYNEKISGFNWTGPQPHRDAWNVLPS